MCMMLKLVHVQKCDPIIFLCRNEQRYQNVREKQDLKSWMRVVIEQRGLCMQSISTSTSQKRPQGTLKCSAQPNFCPAPSSLCPLAANARHVPRVNCTTVVGSQVTVSCFAFPCMTGFKKLRRVDASPPALPFCCRHKHNPYAPPSTT